MSPPVDKKHATRGAMASQKQTITHVKNVSSNESFKQFEFKIEQQIKGLRELILKENQRLTEKLDKIDSDFVRRFEMVDQTLDDLSKRVQQLEMTPQPPTAGDKNTLLLAQRVDDLEREKMSSDAILVGIPNENDEDLQDLYNTLCESVNCTPKPVPVNIFRAKPKDGKLHSSIIIKFNTPTEKNNLLGSIHRRWKETKTSTCLRDVVIPSDSTTAEYMSTRA